jgi:hypothetical protein
MGFPHSERKALLVSGYGDEMHVIGHQTPSDVLDTETLALLRQLLQVLGSIGVGEEDVHAADAALRNVVWETRNDDASDVLMLA